MQVQYGKEENKNHVGVRNQDVKEKERQAVYKYLKWKMSDSLEEEPNDFHQQKYNVADETERWRKYVITIRILKLEESSTVSTASKISPISTPMWNASIYSENELMIKQVTIFRM